VQPRYVGMQKIRREFSGLRSLGDLTKDISFGADVLPSRQSGSSGSDIPARL
jgi:hypothetical protein